MRAVQLSQEPMITVRFLFAQMANLNLAFSTRSAQGIPRHVYRLLAGDFFQICHKSSLNKIVEAMATVNLYENRTASACL